ncbi:MULTISPECIES: ATP-dependent RNA helicase HrpA [unclassified Wenzhouxiangella]|uniref:ATP-dependent RNA helicase HrpA n=1 Tax=unclassified Wenzhouxiangella TaxID=2613841 RepID=UPI000E32A8DC|nr:MULTISPECIES: ATP-dependent RNA helicase HrpA [unclassified Wenzhouxiangella]RFF28168.1 ATP-dependent RNA helicase HrpA [Wenzhouxiangella sp. 15181]RFP67965.1 ATP-dependent RNA helicase HrpA [Wenzhouxiangella sp. 15190]
MSKIPTFEPAEVMQRDIAGLKRRHKQLARFRGPAEKRQRLFDEYRQWLDDSRARRQLRAENRPDTGEPPDLPISAHAESIVEAIRDNQVVIVAGETGSGKSTQLPKLCLDAGRGERGLIGCTQPRRIAARSVARRVAEELGTELGKAVGFQVRFTDRVSDESYIKFMTDGILLAEVHHDRLLDAYDTLIIDEAHERSLNIDFLLGYLKRLTRRRPDLKIIITSATIDTERFAEHFDDAPVITVEGRGYPVDIQYQEPKESEDLPQQVRRAVDTVSRIDSRGDILVFLPGEREIFQVSRALKRANLSHTEVLPLYARLPAASQDRIFKTGTGRRIVLATNVAETSLTVPGIRFVIDSGLARISRYAAHSKVLRLPVEPVSQASCNQRAGRCGRVGPGTCIRLFDETDFLSRPDFTEPEIQRAGLVGVVLEMLALGLGDPEDFPFVDAPPKRLIGEARQSLFELGAIDEERRLTKLGRQLARLPVDVRHARMLVEAAERGALAEMLVLVAGLSIPDVRDRPLDQQQAADQAHQQFMVQGSDFLTLLEVWRWWQDVRAENSRSQADKLARGHFLAPQRLHEWGQLHGQLKQIARDERWRVSKLGAAEPEAIHRSLLAGLLGMVGQHQESGEYQGARGHKFRIFPGSVLAKSNPGWIMAAELVETARPYARMVAPVKPEWLEQQGAHLLKRRVFDPHWDKRSGRVMGYEQLSLHGLVLVEKRRIHYGPHDPDTARSIFIRHALVRGEIHAKAEFLKRNAALKRELAEHEHKRRRRDVLVAEAELEAFFAERLPADIYTTKAFARWYEKLDEDEREHLLYDRATLLRDEAPLAGQEAFPESLAMGPERFRLHYHFDPASERDGVTLDCPLHLLNRLDPGRLQWLVPGLLEEKVTALIASLPKAKRRSLVPAADYARAAIESLGRPEGALLDRLAEALTRMSGMTVEAGDFKLEKLPRHLNILVRVQGEGGKILGQSRDIDELIERFSDQARREFMDRQAGQWQRDGLGPEEFPDLPEVITTRGGHRAWPALVDQENRVGIRLFDTEEDARVAHREGLLVLLREALRDKWKYLKKNHGLSREAQLAWTRMEDVGSLTEALRNLVLRRFQDDAWTIRNVNAFNRLVSTVRRELLGKYGELAETVDECLRKWHELSMWIDSLEAAVPSAFDDMRSQLDDLMYAGFLDDIEADRLAHYPRYLEALRLRLEALELDPRRDKQRMDEVQPWWQRYFDHLAEGGWYTPALDRYRWLVEEYRVQQFAQKLGTAEKTSPQRLRSAWSEVVSESREIA